jgi:hypothetical protein
MRKALRATVFALALSCPTFAGIIHTPGTPQPPPPPPSSDEPTTNGQMHYPVTTDETTTGVVLTLINSALTLL